MAFVISYDRLDEACKLLNIRVPKIQSVTNFDLWGEYVPDSHTIFLASDVGVKKANRILWHELEHARQARYVGQNKYLHFYATNRRLRVRWENMCTEVAYNYPFDIIMRKVKS